MPTATPTVTEQIPLGLPVPALTPHAIISSMPKWKDNIAFIERDPHVCNSLVTGYPRFIIHKSIQLVRTLCNPGNLNLTAPLAYIDSLSVYMNLIQLQTICERKFGTPSERSLLFPSAKLPMHAAFTFSSIQLHLRQLRLLIQIRILNLNPEKRPSRPSPSASRNSSSAHPSPTQTPGRGQRNASTSTSSCSPRTRSPSPRPSGNTLGWAYRVAWPRRAWIGLRRGGTPSPLDFGIGSSTSRWGWVRRFLRRSSTLPRLNREIGNMSATRGTSPPNRWPSSNGPSVSVSRTSSFAIGRKSRRRRVRRIRLRRPRLRMGPGRVTSSRLALKASTLRKTTFSCSLRV